MQTSWLFALDYWKHLALPQARCRPCPPGAAQAPIYDAPWSREQSQEYRRFQTHPLNGIMAKRCILNVPYLDLHLPLARDRIWYCFFSMFWWRSVVSVHTLVLDTRAFRRRASADGPAPLHSAPPTEAICLSRLFGTFPPVTCCVGEYVLPSQSKLTCCSHICLSRRYGYRRTFCILRRLTEQL